MIGKHRLSYIVYKLSAAFLPIVFRPTYPHVIAFFASKRSFRCLPLSSPLDPLEGIPVFQIWHRVGKDLRIRTYLEKNLTSEFLFQVTLTKTLCSEYHCVSERSVLFSQSRSHINSITYNSIL